MYIFSNVLGVFVFDDKLELVDQILFEGIEGYKNRESLLEKMRNNHKNLEEPDSEALKKILIYFSNKRYFSDFCAKNLELTKYDVKNSVISDTLVIQSVNSVDEFDRVINILAKRLREWYGLYNPETSRAIESHESFVQEILEKEKSELLKELKINPSDSIGADLNQGDLEPIRNLIHQIYGLFQLRKIMVDYVSNLMDGLCPNIKAVCGTLIGAKLIAHAGSLKRLSEMPASTIQVLGAENALFRHMRTGAKSPRHGLIVHHPLIARAPNRLHGKIARALADKISIASKVDYFHGNFIGDKLKEGLEKRFENFLK